MISIARGSDVGISNGSSRVRVAMKGQWATPACVVNGSVIWHCSASGMVGDVDTGTCRSKTPRHDSCSRLYIASVLGERTQKLQEHMIAKLHAC